MNPQTTSRQAKFEERQSSILRAVSKVIARDGFEGASMRAMAAQSRIGLSGIYYYYKNKDELLFAIPVELADDLARREGLHGRSTSTTRRSFV